MQKRVLCGSFLLSSDLFLPWGESNSSLTFVAEFAQFDEYSLGCDLGHAGSFSSCPAGCCYCLE